MDTPAMPDVTKMQAGAGGTYVAILALAIQAGLTGTDLLVVAATAALVACAAILADAIIRHGRAGALAAEMQGLQGNLALTGVYGEAVQKNNESDD